MAEHLPVLRLNLTQAVACCVTETPAKSQCCLHVDHRLSSNTPSPSSSRLLLPRVALGGHRPRRGPGAGLDAGRPPGGEALQTTAAGRPAVPRSRGRRRGGDQTPVYGGQRQQQWWRRWGLQGLAPPAAAALRAPGAPLALREGEREERLEEEEESEGAGEEEEEGAAGRGRHAYDEVGLVGFGRGSGGCLVCWDNGRVVAVGPDVVLHAPRPEP